MSYRVTNYADPSSELERLQLQADVIRDMEYRAFVRLGLPTTGRVLEIGCGPGYFASQLATNLPELTIVGIDVDDICVKEARQRIPVIKADGHSLPIRDCSLDAAYARLALRHIARPESVLSAAYAALRGGGRILVEEVDNASHIVFPEIPMFGKILEARHDMMRRFGGDPYIGRRVITLLRQAGFVDISAVPIPICSAQIGRERFADVVLSAFAVPMSDDTVGADELRSLREAITDWKNNPDAFGITMLIVFGGSKAD
jgi:ubiquinone/menaquinone biosynthesis C-methylase UbiE